MFIIRTAFWLSLLILILPTDEQKQQLVYGNTEAAVKDLRNFCTRNPGVCEASKNAAYTFSQKAKFGAKMLMDFVQEKASDTNYQPSYESGNRRPSFLRRESQNTLTAEDMRPAWSIPSNNGSGV
jgi:Family of unknown function (DUF5330)